jgi:hypothetical protein
MRNIVMLFEFLAAQGNVMRLFDLATYQLVNAGYAGGDTGHTMMTKATFRYTVLQYVYTIPILE